MQTRQSGGLVIGTGLALANMKMHRSCSAATGGARRAAVVLPHLPGAAAMHDVRQAVCSGRRVPLGRSLINFAAAHRRCIAAMASASATDAALPWQAALSDIKKRRDIHSIMSACAAAEQGVRWRRHGEKTATCHATCPRFSPATCAVLGAGPIVIGQACEFDYSGTQACKSLR